MAWSAEETFNSYSNGTLAGNNGGTGWAAAWASAGGTGVWSVQGTTVYEGAKAVSSVSAGPNNDRQLTADVSGAFVMYVALRAAQTNGNGFRLSLQNSSKSGRLLLQFDQIDGFGTVGDLQIISSDLSAKPIVIGYSANTWYAIRITGNTSTGAVTGAASTGSYQGGGSFGSESSSATMLNSGDIRYINIESENSSPTYFVDYISGTNPLPAPPSSIKTVEGLAKASVKTINGVAIASVKTLEGIA